MCSSSHIKNAIRNAADWRIAEPMVGPAAASRSGSLHRSRSDVVSPYVRVSAAILYPRRPTGESSSMPLTLGDLLSQTDLNLELVSGTDDVRERTIAGAHSIEIPNPVPWLERDWIMLTTGIRLPGRSKEQRELVRELADGQIAALGLGIGTVFREAPKPLLDEADRRSFPVFTVSLPTPLRHVVGFVNKSLLSTDYYLSRRLIALQDSLVESLHADQPEIGLIERLASLLRCTVLLYTPAGNLEASTGDAPFERIWKEVCAHQEGPIHDGHVAESRLIALPVSRAGHLHLWMVVLVQGSKSGPEEILVPTLHAAKNLLEAVTLARKDALARERAVREELLDVLLRDGDSSLEVTRQLRLVGLDFSEPAQVLLLKPPQPAATPQPGHATSADTPTVFIQTELENLLSLARKPYLVGEHHGRLACLVQGSATPITDWAAAKGRSQLLLAIGRPISAAADTCYSFRDAELALTELDRGSSDPDVNVLTFDEFNVTSMLITLSYDDDRIVARAQSLLNEVKEAPELYRTLLTYFASDLDVGRAAAALSLHPNSLRYRLGRIEEIAQCSLRNIVTVVDFYLAATIDRLHEAERKQVDPSHQEHGRDWHRRV